MSRVSPGTGKVKAVSGGFSDNARHLHLYAKSRLLAAELATTRFSGLGAIFDYKLNKGKRSTFGAALPGGPVDVDVDAKGRVLAANNLSGQVVRVRSNGTETVLSSGGLLGPRRSRVPAP